MWTDTWRDGRLAVRTLWASPMFTLTAARSVAIGIGSTAVMFMTVAGLASLVPARRAAPRR